MPVTIHDKHNDYDVISSNLNNSIDTMKQQTVSSVNNKHSSKLENEINLQIKSLKSTEPNQTNIQ